MAPISKRAMRRSALIAACALLGRSSFAQQAAAPTGMKQADHLRNVRYCEIFVVTRHGFSAIAAIYNTVGLNDCPDSQWHALNVDRLESEPGAYLILLNGPRYFVMDRNALRDPGPERDFNGLQTRLVAELEVEQANEKRVPYSETAVQRQSCYVYEADRDVYELHSPNGRSYIMQSYSLEVDPNLDEAALGDLTSRLSLPKGWRYEARKSSADLTVCNAGQTAQVLQDSLNNTYQRLDR